MRQRFQKPWAVSLARSDCLRSCFWRQPGWFRIWPSGFGSFPANWSHPGLLRFCRGPGFMANPVLIMTGPRFNSQVLPSGVVCCSGPSSSLRSGNGALLADVSRWRTAPDRFEMLRHTRPTHGPLLVAIVVVPLFICGPFGHSSSVFHIELDFTPNPPHHLTQALRSQATL